MVKGLFYDANVLVSSVEKWDLESPGNPPRLNKRNLKRSPTDSVWMWTWTSGFRPPRPPPADSGSWTQSSLGYVFSGILANTLNSRVKRRKGVGMKHCRHYHLPPVSYVSVKMTLLLKTCSIMLSRKPENMRVGRIGSIQGPRSLPQCGADTSLNTDLSFSTCSWSIFCWHLDFGFFQRALLPQELDFLFIQRLSSEEHFTLRRDWSG